MRKLVAIFGVCIATAVIPATSAQASITISLSGHVYYITPSVASAFTLGQAATAWFTYDPGSPGRAWYPLGELNPNVYFYENAPIAGGMQVGSYSVEFTDSARMFVTNQEISDVGILDRVLFDDHNPIGEDVGGRPIDAVSISFQDNTATALDSLALPSSPSTFAAFPAPRASIDWTPYIGAEHRISVVFDGVTVSAVPEPATWAFMIVGFGAVGGTLRSIRRKASINADALTG